MPWICRREIGQPHERRLPDLERNGHGCVKSDQKRKLQQHRQTPADGQSVLGHLELLHLQLTHAGVIGRDPLFLKVLDLVLDLLHFGCVAGRLLERLRLRPPEREQKRIEKERKDDDRYAVVVRYAIKKVEGVKDRDRERLGQPAKPPIVAEIDQVGQLDIPAYG